MWRSLVGDFFLSEFVARDKSTLARCFSAPQMKEKLYRFPHWYSVWELDQWFEKMLRQKSQLKKILHWAIRSSDGAVLGGLGFSDFIPGEEEQADIFFWLAQDPREPELLSTAIATVSEMGIDELGLTRIQAIIPVDAQSFEDDLKKSGFVFHKTIKNYYRKENIWEDAKVFLNQFDEDGRF